MTELAGTKRENSEVAGSGTGGEISVSTTGTTSIAIADGEANKRTKLESGAAVAPNPAQPQHQPKTSASVAVGQPSQPMKSASESPLPPQAKPSAPAPASVIAPAPPPAPLPVSAGAAAMAALAAKPAASAGSLASASAAKVSQPQSASTSISHAQKPPPIANGAGTTTLPQTVPKSRPDSPPPPLKALTFRHLQKKYSTELDYMLVEFRKLERQLLGAPPNSKNPKPEVAGSKERREKLHGFITHLEDTIRQVSEGCVLEEAENKKKQKQNNQLLTVEPSAEKKTDSGIGSSSTTQQQHEGGTAKSQALPTDNFTAAEASLSHLTPAKEKEESVQRLEEHILANLLPVKIRLTRQLAAQKGATRNPATAPIQPGGMGGNATGPEGGAGVGPGGVAVKGSFAEAAEAKRKAQERALALQQEKQRQLEAMKQRAEQSQYGKPIGQARSSLTSRLHGRVLGGDARPPANAKGTNATTGAAASTVADPTAVGEGASPTKRHILYAGMAPGSTQVPSSINAVSGVHPGLIGEDAARAVSLAEDERKRLAELEASAARVALGINQGLAKTGVPAGGSVSHAKPTASISKGRAGEGPATLAARARAVALASSMSGASKLPRPNHPLPTSSVKPSMVPSSATAVVQQHRPPLPQSSLAAVPSSTIPAAPPAPPPKPKKKHKQAKFNDPALSSNQQFDLRLQEARWRQNKRRRERRRQRTASYITGGGRILTQQQAQAFQQQRVAAPRMKDGGVVTTSAGIPGTTIGITTIPAPKKVNGMHHHHNPTGAGGFGPRGVEYVCAMCNEGYPSSCEINPWWALCSHECPKCGKTQIPRLDITAPSNAMEYHPALLAHLDEGGGHKGINIAGLEAGYIDPAPLAVSTVQYTPAAATTTPNGITYITRPVAPMSVRKTSSFSDSDVSHTDGSDGEGNDGSGLNYDESSEEEGDDAKDDDKTPKKNGATEDKDNGGGDSDEDTVAREERMEREEIGFDYKGEKLTSDQARKLLVLIEHASTCPGRHHSAEHRNVCHSTKYLMLHIRDCTGLLSNGDICPFPWCRKVKHLLYHLVSCKKGPECNTNTNGSNSKCTICCPTTELSPNLQALVGLNTHRRNKFKERVKAVLAKRAQMQKAAAAAAAKAAMNKAKTSTPAPVARPRPQLKVPAPAYRTMAAPPAHAPKLAATIGNVAATSARTQVSTNMTMVAAAAKPSPAAQIMSLVNPTKQKVVQSIPAPATVAAAQSMPAPPMKHATMAVASTATKQLASPTLSATGLTSGLPSALSVTLPTLEEAALEVGDISMSMSDLMGPPSSDPGHAAVSTANAVIVKTEQTNST